VKFKTAGPHFLCCFALFPFCRVHDGRAIPSLPCTFFLCFPHSPDRKTFPLSFYLPISRLSPDFPLTLTIQCIFFLPILPKKVAFSHLYTHTSHMPCLRTLLDRARRFIDRLPLALSLWTPTSLTAFLRRFTLFAQLHSLRIPLVSCPFL